MLGKPFFVLSISAVFDRLALEQLSKVCTNSVNSAVVLMLDATLDPI